MDARFGGTAAEVEALERVVAEIPEIQRILVERHAELKSADRAAHQMQIGAGRAVLDVARELPAGVAGVGLFTPGARAVGIGRVSTGLGCPHLETDPDFLGLMLAFQTPARQRVDFLAINDAGAPTDTVEEFIALLAATAHAAGAEIPFGDVGQLDLGNLTAAQARLFNALRARLGFRRASSIYLHLVRQTTRTARSSSAVQPYWTGVVEMGAMPGKFTFVPLMEVNRHRDLRPGPRYLTDDWARQLSAGDIAFDLRWIPFIDEDETPLVKTSRAWSETHAVRVGTVTFPRTDPASHDARLSALLASEMGANPGHWVATRDVPEHARFPGTTFTAARQLAYAHSQQARAALPQSALQEFFDTGGSIGPALEQELLRRFEAKTCAGHATPGALSLAPGA